MALNHTCRICSRAFNSEKLLSGRPHDTKTRLRTKQFSTRNNCSPWSRNAISTHLRRTAQPLMPQLASGNNRCYAQDAKTKDTVILQAGTEKQGHVPSLPKIRTKSQEKDILGQVIELQAQGKRVGVEDKDGELHVLAKIPDDVRTYNWRTAEWSWGVLERLFQDCEQAKLRFEMEEYVDEEDGRKKKRVKSSTDGTHIGQGSGWWFDVIGLPKTFNTWATVSFLHMWILKVRIRQLPKPMSEHWTALLTNHFFWEAEKTMDFVHKMSGTQRKEYLEQFSQIWRGTLLAYDEGLIKGDAVLAAAIWRQLFNADQKADALKIALVTAYARREVARVGSLSDKVLARGYVGFGKPVSETDILMQSPKMRDPLEGPVGGRNSQTSSGRWLKPT